MHNYTTVHRRDREKSASNPQINYWWMLLLVWHCSCATALPFTSSTNNFLSVFVGKHAFIMYKLSMRYHCSKIAIAKCEMWARFQLAMTHEARACIFSSTTQIKLTNFSLIHIIIWKNISLHKQMINDFSKNWIERRRKMQNCQRTAIQTEWDMIVYCRFCIDFKFQQKTHKFMIDQ